MLLAAALLVPLLAVPMAPAGLRAQPVQTTPPAVERAIEEAPAPEADKVTIGVFVNDILMLDFPTDTYSVDLYVWFRWNNPELNPAKTVEFMNRYLPTEHQRDLLFDEAQKMPDGTLYNIIREQGRFSSKFKLERYPYDEQSLKVVIEDSQNSTVAQSYIGDANAITSNPDITLPGYKVGKARISISPHKYPTNFGDISLTGNESYSRVVVEVPVSRPVLTVSIKTFVPILLIIISSTLVLYIRPSIVEGRIGLAITALLTLVALQLTASAALPDVDYLMLIDKAYLASYAFIIAVLMRVVSTSWVGWEGRAEEQIARHDRIWTWLLLMAYGAVCAAAAVWTFYRF